jgi:adenylosuccinate lyase
MVNNNILSERWATPELNAIQSLEGKILSERELWIAVMKAQKELGLDIPSEDIEKFERSKNDIDAQYIKNRELELKHDVKAKIEAFVKVSGAGEHIHKGMTSRDLTDNVEQMQNKKSAVLIFGKYVSILRHFSDKMKAYDNCIITARTHHQAAQPTLLGRRFSMWAEELYLQMQDFERFIEDYPLRGIKGPVGTQLDMLTLLRTTDKVEYLENQVAKLLGFSKILNSPGQVYPRSLDYKLVSNLALLTAAPENFAKTLRLMAGYELATEGFKPGQVGSTAMPHKMNTPHSERICGLSELVKMYADGASRISGDQWEEGDVSCSAPRRVILADAFYASDGVCETTLDVLNSMGVYPAVIDNEVARYLPFLASTEILMTAVKKGMGREKAHSIIKKHSVNTALEMREKGLTENNLADRLAGDQELYAINLTKLDIDFILSDKEHFVGNARSQIGKVQKLVNDMVSEYQKQADYEGQKIR